MLQSRASLLTSGVALALLLGACKAQTPADTINLEPAATPSTVPAAAPVDVAPAPAVAPVPETTPPMTSGGGWQYQTLPNQYGDIVRAEIPSTSGNERLVFENHPVTGRDAHMELPSDVECPTGCKVMIGRDGGPMTEVLASRPENPNIRLNLDEPRALWNSLRGVATVKIEYPAKSGLTTAEFATAGLDTSKLPGWEE